MNVIYDLMVQHRHLLGIVATTSTILLLLSIMATPRIVSLLPVDYLVRHDKPSFKHPAIRLLVNISRTCLGVALIVSGLIMLIIPGPGLVTLVLGISVARFPGKQKLMQKVASQRAVFRSLNWMRRRHGKPPLQYPGGSTS